LQIIHDKSRVVRLQLPRVFEVFGCLIEIPKGPADEITRETQQKVNVLKKERVIHL